MHLITLRIISNISVLVIAATLSTVDAGKCPPERLESYRSDRDPLAGEWILARRPGSYEGITLLVGPETVPAVAQRRFPAGKNGEIKRPGYNGLG